MLHPWEERDDFPARFYHDGAASFGNLSSEAVHPVAGDPLQITHLIDSSAIAPTPPLLHPSVAVYLVGELLSTSCTAQRLAADRFGRRKAALESPHEPVRLLNVEGANVRIAGNSVAWRRPAGHVLLASPAGRMPCPAGLTPVLSLRTLPRNP